MQQPSKYKIRHAEPQNEMQLTKVKKQNKHYWCIVEFAVYNTAVKPPIYGILSGHFCRGATI